MSHPDVAVIVPTLNEEDTIRSTLCRVLSTDLAAWVIVVDDSSADRTIKKVKAFQRRDPRIHLLVRRGKQRSFARSYVEGFHFALGLGADMVIQMDSDGSHRAADIPRIIEALGGSDVVVCSRYAYGGEN